MKTVKLLALMVMSVVIGGCAFFSPGSKNSLLAGDADLALFQNRTSKNVSKIQDATNGTNSGSSIAEPTGGGTVDISPGSLTNLIRAATQVAPLVRAESPVKARAVPVKATVYTVKKGDTLWGIARSNGTTVTALKTANGLKSATLRPGQMLRLSR